MKKLLWVLFILLAVSIGFYPLFYLFLDMSGGLLATKPLLLLESSLWNLAFYLHISFGGIALLVGWSQFSVSFREIRLKLHRYLGKLYVLSIIISGITGLYVAYYASGGLMSQLGFGSLALFWLFTTSWAYLTIRRKEIAQHRIWMMRSYAFTFAAVTLRFWIPFLVGVCSMDFIEAYRITSWLCWIPNLLVAELFILKGRVKGFLKL